MQHRHDDLADVSRSLPQCGVDVKINGQVITIKGKNGELTRTLNDAVEVKHADNTLT
ncbi:50S ribosomal protein L6, partial [Escherichia sp. R-CC3]